MEQPTQSTAGNESISGASQGSFSQAIDQLSELCRRHPIARKVVFVPHGQLGQALTAAVARHNGGVGGLECQTPRTYASRRARASGTLRDQEQLSDASQVLLVQSLLSELRTASTLTGSASMGEPQAGSAQLSRLAPQVSEAIQTLRLGNVAPEKVRERAEEKQGFLPLLANTYDRYVEALDLHGLYDDADLFSEATQVVRDSESTRHGVYAMFGETELHESALELMSVLRGAGEAFYGAGAQDGAAPKTTAAATFLQEADARQGKKQQAETAPDAPERSPVEPLSASPQAAEELRSQRAVGPLREVRAVLRDILRQGRPLDEVEIAYTASQPYLTLLADEAERLGLPFTLGTGLPLTATRPGQALTGFYEWIESGYDAPVLIRLLRSGLMRATEWSEARDSPVSMTGRQIANVLASCRYGPGAGAYANTLNAAIEAVKEESSTSGESLSETEKCRIQELEETRAFAQALMDLIPDSGSVQEMAAGSLAFLSDFGPEIGVYGEDAMVTEKEKTTEEIAIPFLRKQVLEEIQSIPFDVGETPQQTARVLREMTEKRYVGAQNPTSGALHVLPLDSAGFAGREHLYAVGMDSETAASASIDRSILGSEDRGAFSKPMEGTLPQPRNAAEESAWRFEKALDRHQGRVMLVATTFDPSEGESRHPSTLYLQKRKAQQEKAQENGQATLENVAASDGSKPSEPIEGLVPSVGGPQEHSIFLCDAESWLASTPAAGRTHAERSPETRAEGNGSAIQSSENSSSQTARERMHQHYPWAQHGEVARLARASAKYTPFDGLLKTDAPELDFLDPNYAGPPISAGRLEMLAGAPYAYFLEYVLRVEPREEPALDEEPWLNPKRKGIILHRAFSQFMNEKEGGVRRSDWEDLRSFVEEVAEKEARSVHPGTDAALEAALRELRRCARLFLQSEVRRTDRTEPFLHEWGFGYSEKRRQDGDIGDFTLDLDGGSLPVRGRIDRVDQAVDSTLSVWDYKTGSQSSFSREAPLKHGEKIQWALYALVLEQHRGEQVSESGYFFTSEKEMGTRLGFPITDEVREETEETISHLSSLVRSGSFPIAPKAHKNRPWRFGDWDRLHRDLEERLDALEEDSAFAQGLSGKVRPHFLDDPDE